MTQKLFYEDSSIRRFTATVLVCAAADDGYDVELDRTAFFPGGGGQASDRGTLDHVKVLSCREENGRILHHTDAELPVGAVVTCETDWPRRFCFMQNHSAEHIVSGTAHRLFGCANVGFHMAEDGLVTLDFDRELSPDQLRQLEDESNDAVFRDVPITTQILPPSVQPTVEYRSKHALTGEIRLVTIEGVDICACCAPHVSRTGQVGLLHLTDAMRHRGGMRMTLRAGSTLLEWQRRQDEALDSVMRLLSARPETVKDAVEHLLHERDQLKYTLAEREKERIRRRAEALTPSGDNFCLFEDGDPAALRMLASVGADRCPGVCAVFSGEDGTGYRYIICSRQIDLRTVAAEVNAAGQGMAGLHPSH
ncbi:MAG: alanyl-tRNA editing protein, partial [Eubacteriales bacterium]|nr:alanyl-tRNA editing protein [Eubacteriales bacterium]